MCMYIEELVCGFLGFISLPQTLEANVEMECFNMEIDCIAEPLYGVQFPWSVTQTLSQVCVSERETLVGSDIESLRLSAIHPSQSYAIHYIFIKLFWLTDLALFSSQKYFPLFCFIGNYFSFIDFVLQYR